MCFILSYNKKTLQDTYRHKGLRRLLIADLRRKGIRDEAVLAAIGAVPRHFFLDKAFEELAYTDQALPIAVEQTISQPFTVAYQSILLQIKKTDRVLEIGSGSGYQACVLAALGARVFTIERQKELYLRLKSFLPHFFAEYKHLIEPFYGDGYLGLPQYAPFDKILVTAAAEAAPTALCEQLAVGGSLVIPIGDANDVQVMCRITRISDSEYHKETFDTFRFVPMLKGKT